MPRNNRKKFRKFLETRRHRFKKMHDGMTSNPVLLFDIACAVLVPILVAAFFAGLYLARFYSPLYEAMYIIAGIVWLIWVAMAFRGAKGFWLYRTHFFFAFIFALLLGLGSCWQWGEKLDINASIDMPAYTHQPSVTMPDGSGYKVVRVLEGSVIHFGWQGEGETPVARFIGRDENGEAQESAGGLLSLVVPEVEDEESRTLIVHQGWHRLAAWRVRVIPDMSPQITMTEEPEITARKTIRFAYQATDDFGIENILVRIAPTTSLPGMNMEPVELLLASPADKETDTASYADLTSLPWAGVPVSVQLIATDGAGHRAWSKSKVLTLPTRGFRNPFARALIEERQKLVQAFDSTVRDEAANVMAGIARQQGMYRGDPLVMMALRAGAVRLVLSGNQETVDVVSNILWQAALRLEEGNIGVARQELAEAERHLTIALGHESQNEAIRPYLTRLRRAMDRYFDEMEKERARQPPALRELDWPLATANEMLTPEDLQNRVSVIEDHINGGNRHGARNALVQLQAYIENLRTTPPELTPAQAQMLEQVSALKAITRAQKALSDDMEKAISETGKSEKARKARRDIVSRAFAQQQLLLSALQEVMTKEGLSHVDAKAGEETMKTLLSNFQQGDLTKAKQKLGETLSLLESTLAAITEQMRRSITAKAP